MRCSSPTVNQKKTTTMSRRKQSNPKPLKPGEDSEWTTNEEAVDGGGGDVVCATQIKCDLKTEQQQQPSTTPPPCTSTAEPKKLPPAAVVTTTAAIAITVDTSPKLRVNPNLATDPAKWRSSSSSSSSSLSAEDPSLQPPPSTTTASITNTTHSAASSSSSSSSLSIVQSISAIPETNVVTITAPRAIQIFICNPCGIRFSSMSTLDAHQTYYCSRRHKKDLESNDPKVLPPIVIESDDIILVNDSDSRPSSVEPTTKSARTGKQYKCPHCSYSADKKVSLNRHMRMHSVSPMSIQSPPCPTDNLDPSGAVDRYCQNCDIRFSNLRTYQAHKTHYCNTRHVVKPTPSSSPMPNNSSPTNNAPCTHLALPTNPVIVVPYALVQNASFLPSIPTDAGPSPPTDTACIVLSDGTLKPIAQALVPTKFNNIIANNQNIQRANSLSPSERSFSSPKKVEMISQENKIPIVQLSSPLDLRLKRSVLSSQDDTDGEEEKENRRSDGNITDAEDIVCAPSIDPCMILSPSSSPPSGNKTPQLRSGVQPMNGVIQKSQTSEMFDNSERNGNFSVSSLLHMTNTFENLKQESICNDAQPSVMVQPRYSPIPKSRNIIVPTSTVLPSVVQRGDLLNPTVLPYFTSEMTLRLATNPVQAEGLPGTTHQFFLKQGPSKCESCNIVFCKYENFLAHKKHYCASRPPQNDIDFVEKNCLEGSPGPKPLMVSSPQSTKDSVSPTQMLKSPMIQFICSTCGVKFSSFDNLTTHQSYYCPNRITSQDSAMNKSLPKICPKCKMNVEGILHHQCPVANCWKCPVCGTICASAASAQKHLDNHNGIRAFVCTICQYKGNTLRGLRTHIRMHFNKRLLPDLMEEDYVTCVLDENSTSSTADGGARTPTFDVERPSSAIVQSVVTVDDECKESVVVIKQEPSNGSLGTDSAPELMHLPIAYHQESSSPSTSAASNQRIQQQHYQSGSGDDHIKQRGVTTTKYCKACDISFNYLSTFIAHKKYYCKNSSEYKCNAENAKTTTVT